MAYTRERRRPTVYRAEPANNTPGRGLILSTGRGDVRLSAAEAVALGLELLAAAAGLGSAADVPRLVLGLAERVAAQSELLAACAAQRGG